MADLPIPFSAPMVRALLRQIESPGTGKTQTRRVIDFPGIGEVSEFAPVATDHRGRRVYEMKGADGKFCSRPAGKGLVEYHFHPRYAVSDRLYVREHWRTSDAYDDLAPSQMGGEEQVIYLADDAMETWGWGNRFVPGRFRQGMHMPRWASRITLLVTEVRVERLRDCSEADARAEGICADHLISDAHNHWVDLGNGDLITGWDAREVYASLWNQINGPGAWAANPWVAAYTFRPVLGNIDQIGGTDA